MKRPHNSHLGLETLAWMVYVVVAMIIIVGASIAINHVLDFETECKAKGGTIVKDADENYVCVDRSAIISK